MTELPDGVTTEMVAAMEILIEGGVPLEHAAKIAASSDQQWRAGHTWRTPEQFARHFLTLRKAAQGG